jgi:hypothetical protein
MGYLKTLTTFLLFMGFVVCTTAFDSQLFGADLRITYQNGETQNVRLNQNPSAIRKIEMTGSGEEPILAPSGAGIPVTIYWHMADDADVYLNGQPLRRYDPSFKTRGDEAPHPAFFASAVIYQGDVFTVGGRRGGSFGFMLIAVDSNGRVVFQTDSKAWKVYAPGDREDWYLPTVAQASPASSVTVQQDPWQPQKDLNQKYGNSALSIWDSPNQTFAYMYGIVRLMR